MEEWYCPECDLFLIPERVTFEETCVACGSDVEVKVESEEKQGVLFNKFYDYVEEFYRNNHLTRGELADLVKQYLSEIGRGVED